MLYVQPSTHFLIEHANDSHVVFSVWDIWDKGRRPQRATLKHASIYDYYDILEEIGR